MVTVVRQRLPHALRSTHSVAIHSEKSDATKGRCPGRCQEAHRPHSDAYRLDHLVRLSLAPLELASFGAGAFAIFLSRFSKSLVFIADRLRAASSSAIYSSVHAKKKARPMGQAFPPCRLTIFPLVRAKSDWKCGILSVAILRRIKGRLE